MQRSFSWILIPRGVVKSSLIYNCYFFLHMDMFQDEVSVFGSKIAPWRGKTDTSVWDIAICLHVLSFLIYIFLDMYIYHFTKSCHLICCNFLYFVLFLNICSYIANITHLLAVASYLINFQFLRMVYYFVFLFGLDFLLSWHSRNYKHLNTYIFF